MSLTALTRVFARLCLVLCLALATSGPAAAQDWWLDLPGLTQRAGQYDIYWPPLPHRPPFPVVCYFHGATGEHDIDAQRGFFYEFVTQTGYVLIVPRYQSGFGVLRLSTWQEMAETRTRAALDACGTYVNRNKFALIGHSMGGIVSLEIADRRPWWLPVPKAVVMHDPAGYEFTPLLATDPFTVAEEGFVTTDYDRFRNLSSQTQLVALVAKDTWYDSFAGVTSELGFGNGNAGGILSRAWHNTPSTVRKKFLIVWENLSLGRSNHGAAVRNPFYQAVYWRHTRDALSAAFGGRTYVPNLTADPTGINAYLFSGMPAPLPFAWNCASGLPEGIAELLDDREFLELANEFGETGNLMLGLQLLDMLWDADPEFAMALMMAGTDGGATLGDLLGGTVTNYHPRDALLGSRLACFLTPLADRNWDWLYAVIESEVFLAELPCD